MKRFMTACHILCVLALSACANLQHQSLDSGEKTPVTTREDSDILGSSCQPRGFSPDQSGQIVKIAGDLNERLKPAIERSEHISIAQWPKDISDGDGRFRMLKDRLANAYHQIETCLDPALSTNNLGLVEELIQVRASLELEKSEEEIAKSIFKETDIDIVVFQDIRQNLDEVFVNYKVHSNISDVSNFVTDSLVLESPYKIEHLKREQPYTIGKGHFYPEPH